MTRFNETPMTDAQRNIIQMGIDRERNHNADAIAELGYCPKCDHEYTKAQVESIDHDRAPTPYISECPNCHTEEERILYWCNQDLDEPIHAPKDCEKYK